MALVRGEAISPPARFLQKSGTLPELDQAGYDGPKVSSLVSGIPTMSVAAAAVPLDFLPEHQRQWQDRTPVGRRGWRMVAGRIPHEQAMDNVFRPRELVVEVGRYPQDSSSHIADLYFSGDVLVLNGQEVDLGQRERKTFLHDLSERRRVSRIVLHGQDDRMQQLVAVSGLESRETSSAYHKYGGKSQLLHALAEYQLGNPGDNLSVFGRAFRTADEAGKEVERLRHAGVGAYIKIDSYDGTAFLTGGQGHFVFPKHMKDEEIAGTLQMAFGKVADGAPVNGIVQMHIPNPRVVSLSTGMSAEGLLTLYLAHVDLFDPAMNNREVAVPIGKNDFLDEVLTLLPSLQGFYNRFGIKGDQNMDFLVIPPHLQEAAHKLYGIPLGRRLMPTDLNPRRVTGTMTALGRYQQETGTKPDPSDFVTAKVDMRPEYVTNLHMAYLQALQLGLRPGPGGNFSVTNPGNFEFVRQGPVGAQVVIAGTENPRQDLYNFAEAMSEPPSRRVVYESGMPTLSQIEVGQMTPAQHAQFLEENLRILMEKSKQD